MRQQGEASVEEILESIKKVIARDNREVAQDARRRRESEASAPEASAGSEEEVLELDTEAMVESEAEEPLLTEAARESMRENLAALAMLAEPGARPQIVRSGETSLEGLVREMLRPMLSQWLDTHLPPMVEAMVRDEIARIAGKRS
jgi:uncharacterized protein